MSAQLPGIGGPETRVQFVPAEDVKPQATQASEALEAQDVVVERVICKLPVDYRNDLERIGVEFIEPDGFNRFDYRNHTMNARLPAGWTARETNPDHFVQTHYLIDEIGMPHCIVKVREGYFTLVEMYTVQKAREMKARFENESPFEADFLRALDTYNSCAGRYAGREEGRYYAYAAWKAVDDIAQRDPARLANRVPVYTAPARDGSNGLASALVALYKQNNGKL